MPGSAQCTEARETANLPPLEPLPAVAERTLADEICAAALLQQGRAAASAR